MNYYKYYLVTMGKYKSSFRHFTNVINMHARQRYLTILFFGTLYNFNFSEALSQFNWVKGTYDSNSVVASAISEYGKTKTDISTCSYVCMKTQDCNAFSIKSTDKNNCVTYQLADTNIPVSKNSDHPIELWIQKNQFVEASEEEETSSELSFDKLHFLVICSGVMEDYVLKKSIGAITKYPSNPTTGVGHNAPHILIKENNQLNLYVRGTSNEGEMYKFSFDENNFERIPEYDSYKRFSYSIQAHQNGKIFYVGGTFGNAKQIQFFDYHGKKEWEHLGDFHEHNLHMGCACFVPDDDTKVYIIGGFLDKERTIQSNKVWEYDLKEKTYDPAGITTYPLVGTPADITGLADVACTGVTFPNKDKGIMLVGGYYYDIPNDVKTIHTLQTVAMFNLNSKEWKICNDYPSPVVQPTLVFLNNQVYGFCGREMRPNNNWRSLRKVHVIDISEFSEIEHAAWQEEDRLNGQTKCRSPIVVPYNPV